MQNGSHMADETQRTRDEDRRTIQRRAADQAIEDRVALDDMLDLMVHELRNPIAVIKGFASTFVHSIDKLDREQLVTGAQALLRASDRLEALLNSFAEARSVDTEVVALHRTDILLSRLVNDTVEEQSVISAGHPMSVTINDDVLLHVDEIRIRQVLTNLISNAVKYSPAKAPIEVTASRHGDKAHICVTDRGRGIPDHQTESIFHKFSRFADGVAGTGLGLYIARGLARAHGGDLILSETGENGCTFLLLLPIHDAAPSEDHLPR
jgi:signal transduction histidine kinase